MSVFLQPENRPNLIQNIEACGKTLFRRHGFIFNLHNKIMYGKTYYYEFIKN